MAGTGIIATPIFSRKITLPYSHCGFERFTMKLAYRPDIDGLRAIAVLSVMFFHLEERALPGGFVGVDIFFVISGYLITKLIYSELQASGSFSFRNFYLRRLRRLFPALFATLLLSLLLASRLLAPADLVEFAQSLVTSILSISNLFFWSVAGYFDSDSSLKPLLHTWSLSIEEQFYFLWPALLVFLFHRKRALLVPGFIIGMGLVSLLLNHFFFTQTVGVTALFSGVESFNVASTAFYWLPFRVFEFSLGAIVVWLGSLHDSTNKAFPWSNETAFILGLTMIAWSFWQLDSTQPFPSWNAFIPCTGAALIIYSGLAYRDSANQGADSGHRFIGLLSNKWMVGMGLISYSLYLVHWPVIVFYTYSSGKELGVAEIVVLAITSLILACLMYRFIEQPFRRPKQSNKKFVLSAIAAAGLLVSVGVHGASSGGWLWRYPSDMIAQLSYKHGDYSEYFWKSFHGFEQPFKDNGRPKVLIIGDSMAADLTNVLVEGQYTKELDLSSIVIGENCKAVFPLSDKQYQGLYQHRAEVCREQHQKVLDQEDLLRQADTIILISYWWEDHWGKYVESTVDYLKSVSGAKILASGLKTQINNGIWFLSQHAFSRNIDKLRTPLHPRTVKINAELRKVAEDYQYFDLTGSFCNQQGCQRVTEDGFVIIFDDSHFSEKGAKFIAKRVAGEAWLESVLEFRKDG